MINLFKSFYFKLLMVIVFIYYLPNFTYLCVKFGVVSLTPPTSEVLGIEIKLKDEWFPYRLKNYPRLSENQNELKFPTIYFYKNDWRNPWSSSTIVVSKVVGIMANEKIDNKVKLYCSLFTCDFSNPIRPLGNYDPRYDLTFTTDDKDGLAAIISLKKH